METDSRRFIAVLRSSHDRLTALVGDLDDDGLARQSMCTEWSVARVLGHLGSGAEIGLANLEANVAGREPPGPETNPPIWERWNAMEPREVAVRFAAADRRFVESFEALEGLGTEQLDAMQVKLPFLPDPVDVATAVGFRLNEHTLHSWDVFAAFDPSATLAAESVELLIDRLPFMVGLIGRFAPRETRPAERKTITVATADPTRTYELELGDSAELRPADGDSTTSGSLAIPAEALLRLVAGRLRPDRPFGDVEPSGALSLADLRRAFPGY
jgi:uncharacterized protein (TIGR03083 family)